MTALGPNPLPAGEAGGGDEIPLTIPCGDADMIGILHPGRQGARRGIVVVVGGPQVRIGSHRQFVLLARQWAEAGVPVLRFDCRGKGDSAGTFIDFENLDDDIAAAIDTMVARCPGLEEVYLWGLCDGASAILMYAHRDRRIGGVAIVNPWVRTEDGIARTYLKHYYTKKLMSRAFWSKLLGGGIDVRSSLASLIGMVRSAGGAKQGAESSPDIPVAEPVEAGPPFPERMADGLEQFPGRVLVILSGNDLTAAEFTDCVARSRRWRKLIGGRNVVRHDLAAADHTFSRREWRQDVTDWTLSWVKAA